MFPPYCKTPRQILKEYTYRDTRVFNVALRERAWQREREERHGHVY